MGTKASSVAEKLEAVGLADDHGKNVSSLDQATFFRTVAESNPNSLQAILKNRKIDINAYNEEGMTALHLAVYKFEDTRSVNIAKILLQYGANVGLRAASPASAPKIAIRKKDEKHPLGDTQLEAKKITLDKKTPLLLALELKSSLYVRGWEYRHWDQLLEVLAGATVKLHEGRLIPASGSSSTQVPANIRMGWVNVFESGKHELVDVWAEGKSIAALKVLLISSSKVFKALLDASPGHKRIDINEASLTVATAMIRYLYTGDVEQYFMESRGIDLFLAAHKYGLDDLKHLCEAEIKVTPDVWIKLLAAATEAGSDILTMKCAQDIVALMERRVDAMSFLRKSFSDRLDETNKPGQLFNKHDPSTS